MSSRQQPSIVNNNQPPVAGSPLRSPPSSPSPPQPFAIVRLAAAIRSNSDRIAAAERRATGQSELATRHQCDLALRFIAHYAAHNAGGNIESLAYVAAGQQQQQQSGAAEAGEQFVTVDATRGRSLFEVFASLAVHLRVGHAVTVRLDAARSYLKEASVLGDCCGINEHIAANNGSTTSAAPTSISFGATQVIFDSGDAAAAFAELNTAHADRTAPWRIRVCWVQESLRDQFEATFGELGVDNQYASTVEHVRPLGGTVRYTTTGEPLVVDVPLSLWSLPAPSDGDRRAVDVVLVQFFRTCKDVIALLRKQAASSTRCLSVWTENFSITLELAKGLPVAMNVWQNCVGLLDPMVPFTFPETTGGVGQHTIYGSELALCQAVIARRATARGGGVEVAKLSGVFAGELAAENGDYSAMRVLDRITYMTSSKRRTVADEAVADWVLLAKDVQKRRLIMNVVFNQFQTIVVPFGTIFAN